MANLREKGEVTMGELGILLVDDHPIVSQGLELLLNRNPDLSVLGTAGSATTGLSLLKKLLPDVVILDLSMPDMNGLDALKLFRDARPETKYVIYTASVEEIFVYQALQAGAHGYVVKGADIDELIQAISFVKKGGYWVGPQFSENIVRSYLHTLQADDSEQNAYEQLTDRERQVFRLMVTGKQTEEIGDILCISVNTVAKHRGTLMAKLGMDNVVEMTRFAIRSGIIEA